jgi:hypothetical protein
MIEYIKKEFPILGSNEHSWDLNKISESDILQILENQNLLPEYVLYFKNSRRSSTETPDTFDYKEFPDLFTNVDQVSFDMGGLIVMEYFCGQIYVLFNKKGERLSESCHDLDLGTDGLILLRTSDSFFWEKLKYDGKSIVEISGYGPLDYPHDFPRIGDRDIIREQFQPNEYPIPDMKNFHDISKEGVKSLLTRDESSYRYLVSHYKNNKELAIIAVKSNYLAFTLLSKRFQRDREYLLKLIAENDHVYNYLNKKLKEDKEIIRICLKMDTDILRKIAPVADAELILKAIKFNAAALRYATDELLKDRGFILNSVKANGNVLHYVSEVFQADKEIVLEALKSDGETLQYASKQLRSDMEIVMQAIKQSKLAIKYASEELQSNVEFLETIKNSGLVYDDTEDLPF